MELGSVLLLSLSLIYIGQAFIWYLLQQFLFWRRLWYFHPLSFCFCILQHRL